MVFPNAVPAPADRCRYAATLHMRATPKRPISGTEAACIRVTIERAPVKPDASKLTAAIGSLRVVGGCDCGCASVDFEKEPSQHSQPIADGIGKTALGGVSLCWARVAPSRVVRFMIAVPAMTI
jgi:hypothetical protein